MQGKQGMKSRPFLGLEKGLGSPAAPEPSAAQHCLPPLGSDCLLDSLALPLGRGSQSALPGPVATGSPGHWLEMQILPAESDTLPMEPSMSFPT